MISKIKTIQRMDNAPWHVNGKQFYDFLITLENGTEGTASSLSPDSPPYRVGDEVEVEVKPSQWGTKLKVKKLQQNQQSGNSKDNGYWESKDDRISRQWAINAAMEYLAHATTDRRQFNPDEIKNAARIMIHLRDTLMEDTPIQEMPF